MPVPHTNSNLVVLITYMLTPCITLTLSAIKNKSTTKQKKIKKKISNNKWKFKRYYNTSRPTKCAHIIYKSIYTIINKHIPRSNNNNSSNNSNAWSYIKSIRLLCHHFLFCRNYNLMLCQAVFVCVYVCAVFFVGCLINRNYYSSHRIVVLIF